MPPRTSARFYRNLKQESVRIKDINLQPRGFRDVVKVDKEMMNDPKFAPSIGTLLEEITEEEYNERIAMTFSDPIAPKDASKRTVPNMYGDDIPVQPMVPYAIRKQVARGEWGGITGASEVTVGRDDPAAGKKLSDLSKGSEGKD